MTLRVRLLKSWQHPYRSRPYPVGTIIQPDLNLAGALLADKIGEIYEGDYPPKEKMNFNLKQLTTK